MKIAIRSGESPFLTRTVLLALGLLLSACAAAPLKVPAAQRSPTPSPQASPPISVTERLGSSVEGRPIESTTLGRGEEVVLIIATIHGNEAAGTPLVRRLCRELRATPSTLQGRRVIVVPVTNPDGHAASRRTNAHGIDLNRNFPTKNFRPSRRHGNESLSEPESRLLYNLVRVERPARVVSIHQPLSCIDWDGPAEPLARAMAAHCDLPARRLGSRPGSFGSWVGETLGIPIITLELPREADHFDAEALWKKYGPMMLSAIEAGGQSRSKAAPAADPEKEN